MKIEFELWGMQCFATGSLDDFGNFEADEILVAGRLDAGDMAGTVCAFDELQLAMDKAAADVNTEPAYNDNTQYFGEGC